MKSDRTMELVPKMQQASAWLMQAADGERRTVKQALQKFDLEGTYSNFWLLHRRNELVAAGHTFKDSPTKQDVKHLRDVKRCSWGEIAARFGDPETKPFGVPEATIRRLYREATGKHDTGQRIGHGGRWLGGVEYHEALYRGHTTTGEERMQVGTIRAKDEQLEKVVAAILAERQAEQTLKKATTRQEKAKAQTDLARKQAATKQAIKDAKPKARRVAPKQAAEAAA